MPTLKTLCHLLQVTISPTAVDSTAEAADAESYHATCRYEGRLLPVRLVTVRQGEPPPTGEQVLGRWLADIRAVDGVPYRRWCEDTEELDDEWALWQYHEHQRLRDEFKQVLGEHSHQFFAAWQHIPLPAETRRFYYRRDDWAAVLAESAR